MVVVVVLVWLFGNMVENGICDIIDGSVDSSVVNVVGDCVIEDCVVDGVNVCIFFGLCVVCDGECYQN